MPLLIEGHDNLAQLLREQARAYICSRVGHSGRFRLPLQISLETREALVCCRACGQEWWQQFPEEGFTRLLADQAAGKIV